MDWLGLRMIQKPCFRSVHHPTPHQPAFAAWPDRYAFFTDQNEPVADRFDFCRRRYKRPVHPYKIAAGLFLRHRFPGHAGHWQLSAGQGIFQKSSGPSIKMISASTSFDGASPTYDADGLRFYQRIPVQEPVIDFCLFSEF